MSKKTVFVSFDYDDDKDYRYLLKAWNANPQFEFVWRDTTPNEIQSTNIDRIKAVLTTKINSAKYTLIIIGKNANKLHRDHALIGFKNWINFEINKSKKNGNKLVGVKIDRSYESPDELINAGASWAMSFGQDPIIEALNKAN